MDSFFGSLPMPGQKGGATPPESAPRRPRRRAGQPFGPRWPGVGAGHRLVVVLAVGTVRVRQRDAVRAARSTGNPRERLPRVRSRGLPDDLGVYPAISRTRPRQDGMGWGRDWARARDDRVGGCRPGGWRRRPDRARDDLGPVPGPIPGRPGPARVGSGLRNARSAQRNPPHLAPCEPSATKSICARSARSHLAQCEPR